MFARRSILIPALATAAFAGGPVRAELGAAVSPMPAERGMTAPRLATVGMGSYTRHDLTRANGGGVREFANPAGQVFAVTWSGPGKPDLRTLLGQYFPLVTGAGATGAALRRPVVVSAGGVEIESSGHMGWFRGVAFIPALAPPGFDAADLPVAP